MIRRLEFCRIISTHRLSRLVVDSISTFIARRNRIVDLYCHMITGNVHEWVKICNIHQAIVSNAILIASERSTLNGFDIAINNEIALLLHDDHRMS